MKYALAFVALFVCIIATAQITEKFYDYTWKPCPPEIARFYSTIEKTDSGWLRNDYFLGSKTRQMRALYEDSNCKVMNGHCYYFYANGNASAIGKKLNNKEEGNYIKYHSNGMISDSAFYRAGKPVGSRITWHRNGYLADSTYHANDSMDVRISWFDDGSIAAAGYLMRDKPHGKWKYYHHNGNLSSEEVYDKGKLRSATYFKVDGTPQADTSDGERSPVFKGGSNDWREYLSKNLYWPNNLRFTSGTLAVVVIEFTINEAGKVENEEVIIPFHPDFDKMALRVIRNSPQWYPAKAHNRKIKILFRQSVTFRRDEN